MQDQQANQDRTSQELTKEQIQALKEMQTKEAWRISQVLWAKHSILKEQEKAEALRNHHYDRAMYLQGWLDGMKVKDRIITLAVTRQVEAEGPIY